MRYYEPPEDVAGTVFDPSDETFGPIMAALQAGEFETAASVTLALTDGRGSRVVGTGAVYGLAVDPSPWGARGVIGDVSTSQTGNTVLRAGRENEGTPGWHQTEHVVLRPDEAREFIAELVALDGESVLVRRADLVSLLDYSQSDEEHDFKMNDEFAHAIRRLREQVSS